MEIINIVGGLAVIAALVVAFGLDKGEPEVAADEAPVPIDRSFAADDTAARFIPATTE